MVYSIRDAMRAVNHCGLAATSQMFRKEGAGAGISNHMSYPTAFIPSHELINGY